MSNYRNIYLVGYLKYIVTGIKMYFLYIQTEEHSENNASETEVPTITEVPTVTLTIVENSTSFVRISQIFKYLTNTHFTETFISDVEIL